MATAAWPEGTHVAAAGSYSCGRAAAAGDEATGTLEKCERTVCNTHDRSLLVLLIVAELYGDYSFLSEKCAAIAFGAGVVAADETPCTDGQELDSAATCNMKCGDGCVV